MRASRGDLAAEREGRCAIPVGILFWVIWVLAFILCLYWGRGDISSGNYHGIGGSLIFLVLTFLLGWKTFGFVVSG